MIYLKNRLMRGVYYLYAIIGMSVLFIGAAHSMALTTVEVHNKGNTDVFVTAVYRVSHSLWKTKGWWKVKPGALNWIKIETGIHGSQYYYLSFLMKNDKGEMGYAKGMEIRTNFERFDDVAAIVNRRFCVEKDANPTDRTSSVDELRKCPPGYEYGLFALEVTVPIFGRNINDYGTSTVGVFIYPDKSGLVRQAKDIQTKDFQPQSTQTGYGFKVENKCPHPIKFALSYMDLNKKWHTYGWWEFKPKESDFLADKSKTRLKTSVSTSYYYAETTDNSNITWSGTHKKSFNGKTLLMKKWKDKNGDAELSLTCNK